MLNVQYTYGMADSILFDGDTAMEHYQVIDTIYEGRPARVLYSGRRGTAQSGVATDGKPDLLFDYNQRFVELISSVPVKRLLLIGGGAYTLPMALLKQFPDMYIDVIELDPGLKAIAERFFGLRPSPRLRIFHQDGSDYLARNAKQYDMVLLDAFSHAEMPAVLTSLQTVQRIARNLTADGIAAVNIISSYFGPNSRLIRSQVANYSDSFKHVAVYPAGRSLFSLWLPQNLVLVAQMGKPQQLELRYGELPALENASIE